ncbi:helix-turn-helix domain-containing protein [Actinophytocola sp. NPDC049390]|uniref:helix-turn-helix domain-containing protein n=1 Tax=Actinophytocola sp. NPDC049390 TaxID=3363894 RepID=UPI0037AF39CF
MTRAAAQHPGVREHAGQVVRRGVLHRLATGPVAGLVAQPGEDPLDQLGEVCAEQVRQAEQHEFLDRDQRGVSERRVEHVSAVGAAAGSTVSGIGDRAVELPERTGPLSRGYRGPAARDASAIAPSTCLASMPVLQDQTSFSELLRNHRHSLGRTQRQLAASSMVSVRAIRDLEHGRVNRPRRDTVRLIAAGLGLTGQARTDFERAAAGEPVLVCSASNTSRHASTGILAMRRPE